MGGGKKIRVLLSKLGMDGHDRGILVVAMALKDAGMEVIYLGLNRTVDEIVEAAVQEDVDVVGLSSLADAHCVLAPRVVQRLKEKGMGQVPVILGGLILGEDIPSLREAGVAEIFSHNTSLDDIISYIREKGGGGIKQMKQPSS